MKTPRITDCALAHEFGIPTEELRKIAQSNESKFPGGSRRKLGGAWEYTRQGAVILSEFVNTEKAEELKKKLIALLDQPRIPGMFVGIELKLKNGKYQFRICEPEE